ncbi:MAG TPA: metallophosphoesterase family protein [Cyclobacteriaceae bacterium]|nr:metallophosphoesterase family protein [Cyclobacteriaceae bacterium]
MYPFNKPLRFRPLAFLLPILLLVQLPLLFAQGLGDYYPPGVRPDRVNLTVTQDPSTSMSVTWRTHSSIASGMAEIVPASSNPLSVKDAERITAISQTLKSEDGNYKELTWKGVEANYHSVTLDNLQSNTLYNYRVGDGTQWSEWFQFRTAGGPDDKLSFLYFGDAQTDLRSLWSRAIRQAYAHLPGAALMLHAGDLVNRANRDEEWGEWFEAGSFITATIPQMPSPGNHDYGRDEKDLQLSDFWRPQFTLPQNGPAGLEETCYFTDVQGVRLISLDSYLAEESDEYLEKQRVWLDSILSNNPNTWTTVVFHHPIYSPKSTRDNKRMRETFKPLFDQYKVDLVLQGHDHTYARGMENIPMEGNGIKSGTMYVVSVSGPKMTDSGVEKKFWMEESAVYTQLYHTVIIEGDKLEFRSFTTTGELYDAFDLIKRNGEVNQLVNR